MRCRKVEFPPFRQTKNNSLIISSSSIHWTYFTRKYSRRAGLTPEGNEENYGWLLSLSTANICRINEFAVYNLFSTLAKLVPFHPSWGATGAWIIYEDSASLSCSLALRGRVCTRKHNEVKSEARGCTLEAGMSHACLWTGDISMSLEEEHQGNGPCCARLRLTGYSQNGWTWCHTVSAWT